MTAMPRAGVFWWENAACAGQDPNWWTTDWADSRPYNRRAVEICEGCPVREPCRDHMITTVPLGPHSIIAGGWVWNAKGQPRPHRWDRWQAHDLIHRAQAALEPARTVTVQAAAAQLGMTYSAVRAAVDRGTLRGCRDLSGRLRWIPTVEVNRYRRARRAGAA